MIAVLNQIFIPLILTILVEEFVFILLAHNIEARYLVAVAAVNIATNPVLNFLLYIIGLHRKISATDILVVMLEIIVVIVEWMLFNYMLDIKRKNAFLLSMAINFSSYTAGLIMFSLR